MAEPSSTTSAVKNSADGHDKARAGIPALDLPREIRSRSWLQRIGEHLRRDRVRHSLRTLAFVVPLTILIWIYAEREQVMPPKSIELTVEFRTHASDRVVSLPDSEDTIIKVQAEVAGPRAGMEALLSARTAPISLTVPDTVHAGEQQSMDLADALTRTPLFVNNGLSKPRCDPGQVKVRVDRLVTREFAVEVDPRGPSETLLRAQIRFEPATVEVQGPEPLLNGADAKSRKVFADLSQVQDKVGIFDAKNVALRFSEPGHNVSILRRTVNAQVNVPGVKAKVAWKIPVYVASKLNIQVVRGEGTTENVDNIFVIGTPEQIKQLESRDGGGRVYLVILDSDLNQAKPNSEGEYKVVKKLTPDDFNLPCGVVADREGLPEVWATVRKY